MTIELTRESVSAALDKAIQERGETWTYPNGANIGDRGLEPREWLLDQHGIQGGCRYFGANGVEPRCIVGYVLAEHGWTRDTLRNAIGVSVEGTGIRDLGENLTNDTELLRALERAQDAQDNGDQWRDAVDAYKHHLDVWDS